LRKGREGIKEIPRTQRCVTGDLLGKLFKEDRRGLRGQGMRRYAERIVIMVVA